MIAIRKAPTKRARASLSSGLGELGRCLHFRQHDSIFLRVDTAATTRWHFEKEVERAASIVVAIVTAVIDLAGEIGMDAGLEQAFGFRPHVMHEESELLAPPMGDDQLVLLLSGVAPLFLQMGRDQPVLDQLLGDRRVKLVVVVAALVAAAAPMAVPGHDDLPVKAVLAVAPMKVMWLVSLRLGGEQFQHHVDVGVGIVIHPERVFGSFR